MGTLEVTPEMLEAMRILRSNGWPSNESARLVVAAQMLDEDVVAYANLLVAGVKVIITKPSNDSSSMGVSE